MTFAIRVDAARWRAHVAAQVATAATAGAELVPVVKSNGYGLGQSLLAREASRAGIKRLAVGTVYEAEAMLADFPGEITVLEPLTPRDVVAAGRWLQLGQSEHSPRLVRTIADPAGLALALDIAAGAPAVLELQSKMRRFGSNDADFWQQAAAGRDRLQLFGITVHLPLFPTGLELSELAAPLLEFPGLAGLRLSVSHLTETQLAELSRALPAATVQLRAGTAVWLGDRGSLAAAGTVLAVSPAAGTFGYRQRQVGDGHVVTVSGGTAHGIGLEAPLGDLSFRSRAVALATGALAAVGRSRSPFSWQGRKLWFVEPPHQHVSMLRIAAGVAPPAVGTELPAQVRFTTTRADLVVGLD